MKFLSEDILYQISPDFTLKFSIKELNLQERKELLFKVNEGYRKIMVADGTWYSYFSKLRIPSKQITLVIKSNSEYKPIVRTETIWQ